ncbi:MAG: hypothetical protein JXD19_05780 [Deltaproteobacteria bacterium]|nr:hypothetical protein [Deltaproteobacteria bacterium]
MIDLHCHLLPGIDDGARDWNESLDMCEIAINDGIHTIVATPHVKPGVFAPTKDLVFSRIRELSDRLGKKHEPINTRSTSSRRSSPTSRPLTILPGADIYLQPDILTQIDRGEALRLGELTADSQNAATRTSVEYVLLELPDYFLLPRIKEVIEKLVERGVIPILTHPERNVMMKNRPRLLAELIQKGALSQVTAMSVTGGFGREVQQIAEKMITGDLVHVIASDAHSPSRRPPIISPAVEKITALIGTEGAERMVREVPQAIIEGRTVERL